MLNTIATKQTPWIYITILCILANSGLIYICALKINCIKSSNLDAGTKQSISSTNTVGLCFG